MAAKSKKRLSGNENKLNKLDKLEIKDVICSICHSILIEPVTLPCYHDFCEHCFNGSIENNALCCPLCRLRIGSWVRTATKQKTLVNLQLWNFIQNKFSTEVNKKLNGEDIPLSPEKILPRLSKPGEIRSEYEAELQQLRAERLKLEQTHLNETVILIKKLNEEEEEAHKRYLESLKHDEMLAKELQVERNEHSTTKVQSKVTQKAKGSRKKSRLKATTLDCYLPKLKTSKNQSIADNTSMDESIKKGTCPTTTNEELDATNKTCGNLNYCLYTKSKEAWNKENGKRRQTKEDKEKSNDKNVVKTKNGMQSLLVSLPLPSTGILQHKSIVIENRNIETGSVDSMQQELCYFKPIEGTTPTSFLTNRGLPLRVPGVRVDKEAKLPPQECPPTRGQYLENLCRLRQLSLTKKLPSAFVIALSILQAKKENPEKYSSTLRSKLKRSAPAAPSTLAKKEKIAASKYKLTDTLEMTSKITENSQSFLRRTRSMGSISKIENETTPKKKVNERKSSSEKKSRLRSDSKRYAKKEPLIAEPTNSNKVNLAVKNLSSPLEDCGVKHILQEQLRIEKLIQQEKHDYELACKMDAEWNGRRQPRRAATKRQVTLNYALRPAKKLKV